MRVESARSRSESRGPKRRGRSGTEHHGARRRRSTRQDRHRARRPRAHPLGQRPGVCRCRSAPMARRHRRRSDLHRARQPLAERLHREFQRQAGGRAAGHRGLHNARRGPIPRRPLQAEYDTTSPHSSLGDPTPDAFAAGWAASGLATLGLQPPTPYTENPGQQPEAAATPRTHRLS
jgi:hypothetical protein